MPTERSGLDNADTAQWSENSRLRHTCIFCYTAFEENPASCPTCGSDKPDGGWTRTDTRPDPWLGRSLDNRYRLVQRLGRGSAGDVYRATKPHIDGQWAIKMIVTQGEGTDSGGRTQRERAVREVQILSSIPNPHIVDFHDLLELPGGVLAVVMDFVDGSHLGDLLAACERCSIARAARIATDIASGLRDVHARGVVHRDLKPANVMIHSPGTEAEFAELIDFGIARFQGESQQTVGFIGTPRYTSPEQARGERAGPSSDIYNLGMLLHHMLSGSPPFPQDDIKELLKAHSAEQPPTLKESSEGIEFPEALENLVASMLAKHPADRPNGMKAVIEQLQDFVDYDDSDVSEASEASSTEPGFAGSPQSGIHRRPGGLDQTSSEPESDSETPREQNPFTRQSTDVYDYSADGYIAFCDEDNAVHVTSPSGSYDSIVLEPSESVTAVSFAGDHLLVGQSDGTVAAYDLETRHMEELMDDGPTEAASAVAQDRDGGILVTGFSSGIVVFRGHSSSGRVWRPLSDGAPVIDLAVHADGNIAVIRQDGQVELFNLSDSHRETKLSHQHDSVMPVEVVFSSDGYLLAVRLSDGTADVYNTVDAKRIGRIENVPENTSEVFETL
jgi:serine/threonine protein kinase